MRWPAPWLLGVLLPTIVAPRIGGRRAEVAALVELCVTAWRGGGGDRRRLDGIVSRLRSEAAGGGLGAPLAPSGARDGFSCDWRDDFDLDSAVAEVAFGAEWRRQASRVVVPDECAVVDRLLRGRRDDPCALRWRPLAVALPNSMRAWYGDDDLRILSDLRGDVMVATRIAAAKEARPLTLA